MTPLLLRPHRQPLMRIRGVHKPHMVMSFYDITAIRISSAGLDERVIGSVQLMTSQLSEDSSECFAEFRYHKTD